MGKTEWPGRRAGPIRLDTVPAAALLSGHKIRLSRFPIPPGQYKVRTEGGYHVLRCCPARCER